ncbi:hypothetical protein CBR_g38416 [Chara braunii]|uniref:Uncharacterized protein n=1 Tax=Chara braunii TaxID=69332 RepID=A0A388JNI2_CHABU|nr:hypothetical protein CBR_g38416 [Chara braunii]|eukprot:GBG59390.1 hypothetical protein CBR_g38416 [Chara braunii]
MGSKKPEMEDPQERIGAEKFVDLLSIRDWERDNMPKVEIGFFDSNHVSSFLSKFEQIAVQCEWNEEQMLKEVIRYIHVDLQEDVGGVIRKAGLSWKKFYNGMRNKYRLGEEQLTREDLEKMDRYDYKSARHFLVEYERASHKVWGLSEHDKCFFFLMHFTGEEQRDLIRWTGGLIWDKIRENFVGEDFDQYLCHILREARRRKALRDCERDEAVKRTDGLAADTSEGMGDEPRKHGKASERNHRRGEGRKRESPAKKGDVQKKAKNVVIPTCERTTDIPSRKGQKKRESQEEAGVAQPPAAPDPRGESGDKKMVPASSWASQKKNGAAGGTADGAAEGMADSAAGGADTQGPSPVGTPLNCPGTNPCRNPGDGT